MNKLAYWRGKRGLTIRKLAEKSGVGTTTISRLEKGYQRGHISTLGKLAEALQIDLSEFSGLINKLEEGMNAAESLWK